MQTIDTNLLKDSCALMLTIRCWGNRGTGDMTKVQTDAKKGRLRLGKELVISPEYDAVRDYLNEVKDWVVMRTMPFLGMKKGIYMAGLNAVELIELELPTRVTRLQELVEKLCEAFPAQVEEAREDLNGQFNISDYPTVEKLRTLFEIRWNWVAFTVPDGIPMELKQAEAAKLKQRYDDAGAEITAALRSGFAELVAHAVDRLKVEPGQKPKIFRDTLVQNMKDFCDTFPYRNLTNDADLDQLVNRAKKLYAGVDAEKLRTDAELRDRLAAKFEAMKTEADRLTSEKPGRKFDLE